MTEFAQQLATEFGAKRQRAPTPELHFRLPADQLAPACEFLRHERARLITLFDRDQRRPQRMAVLAHEGALIVLGATQPVPALASDWPAAQWAQRDLDGGLRDPDASALEHHLRGLDVFSLPYGPVRSGVFPLRQ